MIKDIDSKYCKDDLIQLMPYTTTVSNLIIDNKEIILLKKGDEVIINKYLKNNKRFIFPNSNKYVHNIGYCNNYNEIFEYNKLYLLYRCSVYGISIQQNYFFKKEDKSFYNDEYISLDDMNLNEIIKKVNREEIENIFDYKNYDAMYVLNRSGNILYAYNKCDGIIIENRIIPTDEEILASQIAKTYNLNLKLNELEDINLYGPILFNKYNDLLVTINDDKISINWFRINFIEKDLFKIGISNVPVLEPRLNQLIEQLTNEEKTKVKSLF